ncbi:type IV toxin-antitoxin system AbiEi family antitoxin [Candidatus Nomurabacteria bacterium]|nr:type IV toxin-antitoxin system AbiEi family antitoxin [Candidatus Nomurabacteria bacterium]
MCAKQRSRPRSFSHFTEELQARGRYTFTKEETIAALHISDNAFHKAAHRLVQEKRIMRIVNKFYAVIPFEYQLSKGMPPTHYIDSLMKFRQQPYYVAVLSAAALHGAAHQSPQELQVVTSRPLPTIRAGRARIHFLTKGKFAETLKQALKTPTGYIQVSTPEATALDLLRYPRVAGGLNNIATVLTELSEVINPKKLAQIAIHCETSYIQRLGYLLDWVGAKKLTPSLITCLKKKRWDYVPLHHASNKEINKSSERNQKWRVVVNETVEADI